jgi:hypothetical protein
MQLYRRSVSAERLLIAISDRRYSS